MNGVLVCEEFLVFGRFGNLVGAPQSKERKPKNLVRRYVYSLDIVEE